MAGFSSVRDTLPTLGVGASLSFGVLPDPVRLADTRGGPSFIEYAGPVQHEAFAKELRDLEQLAVPRLYHPSCLNLCGPHPNPPAWVDAVDAHVRHVKSAWLAQDVATCFVGTTPNYSIQLGYFVAPIFTREGLSEAVVRVREVTSRVSAPLLLEPPPVLFALGDMDPFEWLSELANRTDCGLLLDAGHVVSHRFARGGDLTDGLDAIDFSRVIELHVAGGVIETQGNRRYFRDSHDLPPLPETWRVLRELLGRATELRAVCVECEGAVASSVLPLLRRTRERVHQGSCREALKQQVSRELDASDLPLAAGA